MKRIFRILAIVLVGALVIGCTPDGNDDFDPNQGGNGTTEPTPGGNDEGSGEGGVVAPELTYDLRVLTFEDADYKGTESNASTYWSDLIPSGPYGNGNARYSWYDEGNTELAYSVQYSLYGMGGHAGVSNYVGSDLSQGVFDHDLQAYNVEGGHSGSNFNVHFGYLDDSGMGMMDKLVFFEFGDEVARVIDHMWVTNTTYVYNNLANGVSDFGGNYTPSESSSLKIVAYGYKDYDTTEPTTAEFYLCEGLNYVSTWTKWDLSQLGEVVKVEFNLVGSEDMYGDYGFMLPGYFAYDDVAVRFDKTANE